MKTDFKYSYNVYSLNIYSEIELVGFTESNFPKETAIVYVLRGKAPKSLDGDVIDTVVQSSKNQVLFRLPGHGNVLIKNGTHIIIDHQPSIDWSLIRNLIKNKCIAAIMHQRSWGVLHGSAIKSKDKAVLFLGRSGAGKSTTTAALTARGYDFISDDLCVIKNQEGICMLQPAYPSLRLWENTFDLLGDAKKFTKEKKIRPNINKYYVKPKAAFHNKQLEISHIYILAEQYTEELRLEKVNGIESLKALLEFTYAKGQLSGLGGFDTQFKLFSLLLKTIKVKKVLRPLGQDSDRFQNLISLIENDFLDE